MDTTPDPISLAAARELPWKPGRSAEAFIDGDLEVRFTPRPSSGPQTPHQRDELYIVASGTGVYRVEDRVTPVSAGDLCFAAAHAAHGFENFSDDFTIWIIFYGPVK
jgi:mannose-6-phosphate isomerase-like protein (cupin superfamily)